MIIVYARDHSEFTI